MATKRVCQIEEELFVMGNDVYCVAHEYSGNGLVGIKNVQTDKVERVGPGTTVELYEGDQTDLLETVDVVEEPAEAESFLEEDEESVPEFPLDILRLEDEEDEEELD